MSLETQESRIRAWADAVGAEFVEVISDAGASGTKPLSERKGGPRVAKLLDARKPDVSAIAVLRLDRLGRNAAETLALLRDFGPLLSAWSASPSISTSPLPMAGPWPVSRRCSPSLSGT